MGVYIIKKGKHRAWPPLLGLWFNKTMIRKKVVFDFSAKYDNGSDDTNKLFGVGYFWHHHKDSARFGWRCDGNRFIISAYCYVNGARVIKELCSLVANRTYVMELKVLSDKYHFKVSDAEQPAITYSEDNITRYHQKKWSYPLGLYFGGDMKAPHDIIVKIKKHRRNGARG